MVDLDLDVIRRRGGAIELVDQDEFADHQVKYGYPPEVVSEAEQSASWLLAALESGDEPFARIYQSYFRLVGSDLVP